MYKDRHYKFRNAVADPWFLFIESENFKLKVIKRVAYITQKTTIYQFKKLRFRF